MNPYIVDRIEGAFAVAEDGDGVMHDLPLSDLPAEVHEGCFLIRTEEGWRLDPEAEAAARAKAEARLARLLHRPN